MIRRRIHMLEIAKFYQRIKNREAEKKEKPKGFFRRLLNK